MIPIQISKERLKEIIKGSEATRKEYLEIFRVSLDLDPYEFYPALGRLLKDKIIYFD